MIIAGIDYSLSCPGICVYDSKLGDFKLTNTYCYFRSNIQRFNKFSKDKIFGENHNPWKIEQYRYDDIATWALEILVDKHKVEKAFLEGYSYGSTGKVFHIAENTGILKDRMWDEEVEFEIVPPTTIKKFATGKGNASKEKMYETFMKENPSFDLRASLTPRSSNVISPVSDIVDAYFITKYGLSVLGCS